MTFRLCLPVLCYALASMLAACSGAGAGAHAADGGSGVPVSDSGSDGSADTPSDVASEADGEGSGEDAAIASDADGSGDGDASAAVDAEEVGPNPDGDEDAAASDGSGMPPRASACPVPGIPQEQFRLPEGLAEVSGLAMGASGDLLWMHNDSGDGPVLYGVDLTGALVAQWDLGVPARDWEDIARGPCASDGTGSCLYIGDVGDNDAVRGTVRVYRVPEPGRGEGALPNVETMELTYADGARDVEALAVDAEAQVIIWSKRSGESAVYVVPFVSGPVSAERVTTLFHASMPATPDELLTGMDYDAAREAMVIRTYSTVAAAIVGPPSEWSGLTRIDWEPLPTGLELQGEAVAWGSEQDYWHVAEGNRARVYRVTCR